MTERGASLVDLVITMAIMATLLGLAEPLVSSATRQKARAGETEVAAELRMARHLALTKRAKVSVTFDAAGQMLTQLVEENSSTTLRRYDVARNGIRWGSSTNGDRVFFYPSGRSASPTTIILRTSQGEKRRVTVSITGRVATSSVPESTS